MTDLERVKQDGMYLQYVDNQNDEICLEAIKNNIEAIRFVKKGTKRIYIEYLDYWGKLLYRTNHLLPLQLDLRTCRFLFHSMQSNIYINLIMLYVYMLLD